MRHADSMRKYGFVADTPVLRLSAILYSVRFNIYRLTMVVGLKLFNIYSTMNILITHSFPQL
jgi:hypothetical protein